jgi:flagellar hook assembly protein FlgD
MRNEEDVLLTISVRNDNFISKLFGSLLINIWIILVTSSYSFAADFTVKTLSDYGNVTVMEVNGNYDAKNSDGTINSGPRQAIAKEFLKTHKDEYDFIVIFSNFDFQMPRSEAVAFYMGVKNDIQGIGRQLFDNSSLFGSNGKLQGTIDMGNIETLAVDPRESDFEETLYILAHEQMHRWGAYVRFRDVNGNIQESLLGKDKEHWNFLLDSDGSVLYGNKWQDNGNGTFTSIAAEKYYSPLDLYLMGFKDKTNVPPMLLINNPDIDPARMPEIGTTVTGDAGYVYIDDISAIEGDRVPGAENSQKNFKSAFIFITAPGTFIGDELYGIENIRNGWVKRFSTLTDGKGIMQVAPTPLANIPANPGPVIPPVLPRILPPNIDEGVQWLMANQKSDGSWADLTQTTDRDTAEVVFTLKNFPVAYQNCSLGSQWLNKDNSENIDYLSRKIEAIANSEEDVSELNNLLLSKQNSDSGWGGGKNYMSSIMDTALALKTLAAETYSDLTVISPAIAFVKSKQNTDGGWGGDDVVSTIEATAAVLTAFSKYRNRYQLEEQITSGIAWLTQRQNADGGFGSSPSTVYNTAAAVLTLRELNASMDITNKGINYLLSQQSESGSWNESPYQTALAVSAVWEATVKSDLSIKAGDITFTPPYVSVIPSNIVMNVTMCNLGRTDVPQAKVALYDGSVSDANRIGEQIVAFPGQSSVTLTFLLTINDGNEHTYYVVIDPDNLIQESNKSNNKSVKVLSPLGTYDLEILQSDISASPNPADIFQDVTITSPVSNKGTMNAYNVQLKYYIDDPKGEFDIATSTVDIPAGATIANVVTWRANKTGENLPIAVVADPVNTFPEISKENNKAVTYLTVNDSTIPNLTISYKDIVITPSPTTYGGNANISAMIKNEGFSAVQNIKVNFYKGTPGVDGVLIGSQTIPYLNAGDSGTVSIDWTNIVESGETIIYIKVDPDSPITEISKDDNDAFTILKILNLPDLAISSNAITFTPPAPKDSDMVSIQVTIKNLGEQTASNVPVNAYEGSTVLGIQTIPTISGNSQASTTFAYDTTGKSGAHQITVAVDPDSTIIEQSKDNNSASKSFGVQNASLWLTEQNISPNGDGVKDSTQFFFRLSSYQTVRISLVNSKGQTVKTFSGSDLNNITSGNNTWDGLDDNGMVVPDGQYRIKIMDINNNVLGSLLVVVDNNRSTLTDAIGTKYLLNNNLTCMLPDISDWQWFPDDSSILLNIDTPNQNTPEYPTGLYTVSPDGVDVLRIVPLEWTQETDPRFSYYTHSPEISPNGEKVAFLLNKYAKTSTYPYSSLILNQMWIVDRDGSNLTLIDSQDMTLDNNPQIAYLGTWSPTGEYIFYEGGYPPELGIIKSDGSGKTRIDPDGGYIDSATIRWSPDGTKISYIISTHDTQENYILKVRISDTSGNRQDVFSLNEYDYVSYLEWFDNAFIIASEWSGALWLVDTSGAGGHREFTENYQGEISLSPDRQSIAFITGNSTEDTVSLNIADTEGNLVNLYELKTSMKGYSPQISNIMWSNDSSKVAFVDSLACTLCDGSPPESYNLGTGYIKTKTVTSVPLSSPWMHLVKWFSDDTSILGRYYDSEGIQQVAAINSLTGEAISFLSDIAIPYPNVKLVSPLERYITYYNSVDQSSVCYGRGTQDIWAISSMLNLTADLRVTKEKSVVILKGIASDLNFDSYILEYVDTNNPDAWNLIAPPSNAPVLNDVFSIWVPPYEGTFNVRLIVSDKSGNTAMSMKRLVWGLSSSIANLYKNNDIFSPNGDGVKDTVELHYSVLEPAHLEFTIYDENDKMIRAISKDYANPSDDYITWGGRDSNGNIVPDGHYKINVFDYEFTVELDNTPPDIGLHMGRLMQDYDPMTQSGTKELFTELRGHAIDTNMKSWVIESGEGGNLQEWYELEEGRDILAGKDARGNAISPTQDVVIETDRVVFLYGVERNDIESLVNRKLRITAEDLAGNKNTVVTDFLEERMVLYRFLNYPFLYLQVSRDPEDNIVSLSSVTYNLIKQPFHIGGVETVRSAIADMNLQYHDGNGWSDAPSVMNPSPGAIDLEWDNSGINNKIDRIRVRSTDVLGQEHYSNEVSVEENFNIDACGNAINSLYEDLKLLKFSVMSSQDTRFSKWTDYEVFDFSRRDTIPVGEFGIPLPDIKPGITYSFRMTGIGVSGKEYRSDIVDYNSNNTGQDCSGIIGGGGNGNGWSTIKLALSVQYDAADCDHLSYGKALLSAKVPSFENVWFKSLTYYLEHPDGLQLLREIDLSKDAWGDVTIDTSNLPESSYPVKAVLSYSDLMDITTKELSATNTLIVDRIPPSSQITYPTNSAKLCPVKMSDSKGNWLGIPVRGMVADNTFVKRYGLYYVSLENPTQWVPAMTRLSGKDWEIEGSGPIQGNIATWNITNIRGSDFSLKLKVTDIAGNTTCFMTNFSVDNAAQITNVVPDKTLFSPNGDGILDDVTVNYQIDKDAAVEVKVFRLIQQPDGTYKLDSSSVRTVVSGLTQLAGTENTTWDGKDNSGAAVPDGLYGIAVFATDSCGNKTQKWTKVDVDNTPPTAIIAYPKSGDLLGNIVEIHGTTYDQYIENYTDPHFLNYTLEAGQGNKPDTWTPIASSTQSIKDDILGTWNTFSLNGIWTLRLTATDTVGNKDFTIETVDFGQRKSLVEELNVVPMVFSPNNDGRLDTTAINYSITDSCVIEIVVLDSVGTLWKTFTATVPSAGAYTFAWDGTDNAGDFVPDGAYKVNLHAVLSANPSVTEDETITVVVDSTSPIADIKQPLNNSFLLGDVIVSGTISDEHIQTYSMTYTGEAATVPFVHATQNRENYVFGAIGAIAEGNYILNVSVNDLAENTTERVIAFTVDRTPPKVTLDTPKEGDLYGSNNSTIAITGTIVEKNIESFSLRYGSGDNPSQWTELMGGNAVPFDPQLLSWSVGKNAGIPDGLYTLSLYAKDKVGLTGETKVKVMIDNNPPEVAIDFPQNGGYVVAPSDIRGTATDSNFDKYTIDISDGQCESTYKWAAIKTSTIPVTSGTLASLQVLPSDGYYCLRLTATDKAGNKSEAKAGFKVDTQPPAIPVLSGTIDNKTNARLSWTQDTDSDLAGYNLYRDAKKMNSVIINDITFFDQYLKDGSYAYTVTALDFAGNESKASNEVKLKVDLTPPDVRISVPKDGSRAGGLLDIKGTAYSSADFRQYRISIGIGPNPFSWNIIRTSPVPIQYGTLTQWDVSILSEGIYSIKLAAEDLSGNINTKQITVTVDNTPPAAPVLISATPNGLSVTLAWQANTEPDLAGYLLYRNGQLANVSGIVAGNLMQYLLSGTTYLDKSLPDGKFKYYLIAMDQAGNQSGQSNTIEVTLDTHPPHATITDPKDGTKFQNKLMVKAESPDLDIASVQLQYKKAQDTLWINLGNPVTQTPYVTYLDPSTLGLTYGDYNLSAVATDQGGKTDPSPSFITVTYTDLDAPNAPNGLKALTNGKDVTLTWTANTEADLAGYKVSRASGTSRTRINSSIVTVTTFQDQGLADGSYTYEVTAVDIMNHESNLSNSVSAKVYMPAIDQPYTPTNQGSLLINGRNIIIGSSAEVFVDAGSGPVSEGAASSDGNGNFVFNSSLILGESRITARAKDADENMSRMSDGVVVVYNEPPSPPTGLAKSQQDYDVTLTWDQNTESDLSGYNLFRNDEKLNMSLAIEAGAITASSYYYYEPANAFDSDTSTYWMSDYNYGTFNPVWLEIDLPSPELINHMDIHWFNDWDDNLYLGKDYEIQVWSGYAWITQTKVTGNTEADNVLEFKPSYRTEKIRIYITDVTSTDYYKQVGISEISILKDNLISEPSYQDSNLHDGNYTYTVTAVDYYGFESMPSEATTAAVGDVIPPAAPQNLSATASGSDVTLNWASNTEPDLSGYNVYRKTAQGWLKIKSSLVTANAYTDTNLLNGTYTYRVTAVDIVGNESLPSNEAITLVSAVVLQPPLNLHVNPVPEGKTLNISWEYSGDLPSGYNLYRSTTPGGPYTKVNSSAITATSYLDTGLTNGLTYYYVVVAVDSIGNESVYSNEAMGIPSDTVLPSSPIIFFPTIPGTFAVLYRDKTDVYGFAEPASTVELFKDGVPARTTSSLDKDTLNNFEIESNIWDMALSQDGRTLAYSNPNNDSLWMKILATGNTIQIAQKGYNPVWSPGGNKLAYISTGSAGHVHVAIYDIGQGSTSLLTDDSYADEESQSWSSDGGMMAFTSTRGGTRDVWIKDLNSGLLTQATNSGNIYSAKLSPDGERLAYFEEQNLYIVDLFNSDILLVDDNTDWYSVDWTTDSKRLLFVSYADDENGDLYVYNSDNATKSRVTVSDNGVDFPAWSPDGDSIIFAMYDADWSSSLWVTSSNMQDQRKVSLQDMDSLNYISWSRLGFIAYEDGQSGLNIVYPQGYFNFKDAQLDPGENVFYATAADASDNVSPPSDEISVVFDMSDLPDLAISADDIMIYPPYPMVGQMATITATVRNIGQVDVKDVGVDIYLQDPQGELKLLKSGSIHPMIAGSDASVSVALDTTGKAGTNNLIAIIDPDNKIEELSKTNNIAQEQCLVTDKEGVVMNLTIDPGQYKSNEDANVLIALKNSGIEKDGTVETWIEDQNGQRVATIDTRPVQLPYAAEPNYALFWNTGSTNAGSYIVHSAFKDAAANIITESRAPFTISPDMIVDSTVVTHKIAYISNEDVAITINTKNNGQYYIIPGLSINITITDTSNNVLFTDNKNIANLLPGSTVTVSSTWNTGLNAPGVYNVVVETYSDNTLVASKSVAISINTVVIMTGTITVSPAIVGAGNSAQVAYTIQNTGNKLITGMPVNISIIDPETQLIRATHADTVDLGMNTTTNGTFTFSTQSYALKTYIAALQILYQGNTKSIATASFTVKDIIPPVVDIVSPVSGNSYNSSIDITAVAIDDVSGVNRVEYQIDNASWRLLSVSDPSAGKYSTGWAPTSADNGDHIIGFRAADKAGNRSRPISIDITVQINNMPPAGTVSINNNDSYTSSEDVILTLHATDSSGNAAAKMCINNSTSCTAWEDYTETKAWTLDSGDETKTVYAWYQDSLGNANTEPFSDSIILDSTAPALTVSTLSDGSWTNNNLLNVAGTVTDDTGIQQLTINGNVVTINPDGCFSYPLPLQDELNDISVIATDLAGNQTSDARTVNLDQNAPIITITSPADNMKTKQTPINITGSVDDESRVTVSLNGDSPVPAVMNRTDFSLPIEPVYGINTIEVTATDLAGNTSTEKRTVVFDDRDPSLSITDPPQDIKTNQSGMIVKGETSDITAITITLMMDGNTYTPVVTDGKFEQPVTFTSEKTYQIYVTATNEVGNETMVQRNIVYDITSPAVTVDPVTSPTNLNSQTLTGAMEEGATVSITCPNGTVGTVSYPSNTTWTVTVSDMQEGSNSITVTATDEAGNISQPVSTTFTIQIDNTPPVTTISIGSPVYNTFVTGSTLFTLAAIDDISGVAKTEYAIDGGQLTPYAPFTIAAEGNHTIRYRSTDNAGNIEYDKTLTVNVDNTPPTGSMTINNNASYTGTPTVSLSLSASDGMGIGVAGMCISNTPSCTIWETYVGTKAWTLSPGGGNKTVYVWLQDKLGNTDFGPFSAAIILDTTAPVLTVSTLPDGSWTNNEVLNVSGEVTDENGLQQLVINRDVVTILPDGSFSYPIVLNDGLNTIDVIATDLAGNQTSDMRTVNLDQDAPIITIISPVDNMKMKQTLIDVTGSVDDQSMVTIRVNAVDQVPVAMNGNNFSLQITPVYGLNTIEVTATDLAGNTSTAKRTVTFDDRNPSLSVTDPGQDVKTSHADMIIKGETDDDLTAVTVTVLMNGEIYTPVVTNGGFEQPVTFTDEKTYQIYVKAVDEAGNETITQRNVVYDATAPVVTLNPLTSPASLNSLLLTGTMEDGSTVSVTCPTATVGELDYPTATTWTATLSNIQAGNNVITVTAADEAGNISYPITAYYTMTITITATTGPNGSISPSGLTTVNYGGTQTFSIVPSTGYHIADVIVDGVSQGVISSYTIANVTADHEISVTFTENTCVFAANKVTISGGSYVDSYNSLIGYYSGIHGSNGPVGTNSPARGSITMNGGSKIYGDVWIGPDGDPESVIIMNGGAVIYGTMSALSSTRDMTPAADPGGGTPTSFNKGTTLTSGTYRISSVSLSGNGTATIDGNVVLYVSGSISVSGKAKILILPGSSLTIHINGNMNISGGGIVNQNLDPHTLKIYGTLTCSGAKYSGNSAFYGSIHAPQASINISGGSDIYGSIVGKSVTISGNAAVHCDESL